jgi:hypothetical protein
VDGVNCIAKQQHVPFSGAAGFLITRCTPLVNAIVVVAGPGCGSWVIALTFVTTIGTSNLLGLSQNAQTHE